MRSFSRARLPLLVAIAGAALVLASAAAAETAPSLGPLELLEGTGGTIVAPSLLGFEQTVTTAGGPGFGSARGGAARTAVSEIKITKPVDSATPRLAAATATGKHFKKATIELYRGGSPLSVCLEDAFVASDQVSASAASAGGAIEQIQIAYAKDRLVYGSVGCDSAGGRVPGAVVVLTGLGPGAATLDARVDCLISHCRGSLVVALPGGATTGSGKFSIADGSVKTLALAVPDDSRALLRDNPGAGLKTLLGLNGGTLVGKETVTRGAVKIEGLPSLSVASTGGPLPSPSPAPTPTPSPTPAPTPPAAQSVAIESCSTPVVGTPTMISVEGTLSPARAGVSISLEYVPTNGPAPFPAPITDLVTTDPAGHFAESFDRRREGRDYAWSVTASVAEGGGYAAARSSACSIPIP